MLQVVGVFSGPSESITEVGTKKLDVLLIFIFNLSCGLMQTVSSSYWFYRVNREYDAKLQEIETFCSCAV